MKYTAVCACGHKNTRTRLSGMACDNCLMPIPHYMWKGGQGMTFLERIEQDNALVRNRQRYGLSDEDIYDELKAREL